MMVDDQLLQKPTKGILLLFVYYLLIHICTISVTSGVTFNHARVMIPSIIARNREFGANLVGKYYPRIVPFGPFGFYENLYSHK